VIRRNVRSGGWCIPRTRKNWRASAVIFLAEDSAEGLEELVSASRALQAASSAVDRHAGAGGFDDKIERMLHAKGLKSLLVCSRCSSRTGVRSRTSIGPTAFSSGRLRAKPLPRETDFSSAGDAGVPVLVTNYETAELAREATTAFVAPRFRSSTKLPAVRARERRRVSLSLALGLDKKIAPRCLQPGAGMGGIFAESEMESITGLARENHVDLKVLNAAAR